VSGLHRRVALLTGASGGIGKALAERLAESGVDLFLAYGRHGHDAEDVADLARRLGRRVAVVSADLGDSATPARLVDKATHELGGVDILVANAGTATVAPWQDVDLELWNTTLAVNLTAPFLLAQGDAADDRTSLRARAVHVVRRGAQRRRRRGSLRGKQGRVAWPAQDRRCWPPDCAACCLAPM
jgi:NAD(P)-dependent dehydrogenase (short-subunit alcohol dehydrogenase family)